MSVLNKENGNIQVAVLEGWHPFDIPQWNRLFAGMDDMDCYLQTIDNWAFDCAGCKKDYDVLLFYNMNMDMEKAYFPEQLEKALDELGSSSQGIVMLHHAILAYPKSMLWNDIVGIGNREFNYFPDQNVKIDIVNPDHPITKGCNTWDIHDETYTMQNAGPGSEILLKTNHDKSMGTIAWTRTYRDSRVFCFQCGHDHLAWENPVFREILQRGIKWAGRRL
jgi:uncharacterized protein